ncbi:alpha/beta fold hydrolase [Subtercola lobariae]|uniref:AB hydrolase-1 domain-containing protein n=1 Tax=Subtercola lobariae TaxID=1588641 RepID=A0A917EUW2_9MICO|nr:alpha/beta fold hydrolase [Subtercola lobariae]GGF19638.1 hypothetical protein GCM10011399_11560 [Subtercola lobariae]
MTYRLSTVPGSLTVGEWGPADAPVVLAVHGITASHQAWRTVAALLPEFHLIAPDLRGRGGSRTLPGPFGMARHADDLADVLDHLGARHATVVGHSMGAFASLIFGLRHPALVESTEVPNTNHYTIVMGSGAASVAATATRRGLSQ